MFDRKEYMREYQQTEKYKECQRKYRQIKEHKEYQKEYQKKYRQTKKYKESQKKCQKKYQKTSEKYKEYQKKHQQTERYKFTHAQNNAMRRNLGFVFNIDLETEMPNEPVEYHHANINLVYPIPSDLHEVIDTHNLTAHRFYCHQIINQLYKNN